MRILFSILNFSLIATLGCLCFVSCKEDVKQSLSFHPMRMEYGGSYKSISDLRDEANALFKQRKSKSSNDHLFLVDDWWHIQAYSEIDQIRDLTTGAPYWLKLNADNTYQYGISNQLEGRGRFHYRGDDSALLLIDDIPQVEPTEFDLRYASDKMVLIGKSSMSVNNGTQIMMVLLPQPPKLK